MMLCIDVGNSHIYGGVFHNGELISRFRMTSKVSTSDEYGVFLKNVLRENQCSVEEISKIGICSVVPQLDYSLRSACIKYFSIDPFFLQVGVKTGLNIKYRVPSEVGADRIANAIAAVEKFPKRNLIIIDFGTATTFCAISEERAYVGGVILPGVRLAVQSLGQNTAKLPVVEIVKPEHIIGRSTVEGIQSGVFFGSIGACTEILSRIKKEVFANNKTYVIATGGFASLFDNQGIYDKLQPDLVLEGIRIAHEMNC